MSVYMACFNCVRALGTFEGNNWILCCWKKVLTLLWELQSESEILKIDSCWMGRIFICVVYSKLCFTALSNFQG
jgi:hypothetical protein